MKIQKFKQFESKVSNYKNLREIAIEKFEKSFPRIKKNGYKGSFTFKFEMLSPYFEDKILDVKVQVKFEDRGSGSSGGYMKKQLTNRYIIFINTYDIWYLNDDDKKFDKLLSTYVHEITHISQDISGFLDWDITDKENKFVDSLVQKGRSKGNNSNSRRKYQRAYSIGTEHSKRESEQEANLVSVLEFMRRKNTEGAFKMLIRDKEYMKFENKKFLQKLYKYGVDINVYRNIKTKLKEYLGSKDFYDKSGNVSNNFEYSHGFGYNVLINWFWVYNMFGLKQELKDLIDNEITILNNQEFIEYYKDKFKGQTPSEKRLEMRERGVNNFKDTYLELFGKNFQ